LIKKGRIMSAFKYDDALTAFKALRADVEQFDAAPEGGSGLFSEKVPPHMKSYLVNWLRQLARDHGDNIQAALEAAAKR
jgi:activator of HSP90 ATPase